MRDKIELVQGDIRSFDPAVLDGCDAVLHLAGLSNDPTAEFNPKANEEINTHGTEVVATACKARGIKRFINASTCSIYDLGFYAPDFLRDEESEVKPRAAYAVSNYEAERILLAMADDRFCPVILRQGTVYGWSPRMRYDLVVNTFVRDAIGKGSLTVHAAARCGARWSTSPTCAASTSPASRRPTTRCTGRSSTWSGRTTASSSWRTGCARRSSRSRRWRSRSTTPPTRRAPTA